MTDDMEIQDDSSFITGVSLASFLQMLKLELKSCSLEIGSEGNTGRLFIKKGELIDAESDNMVGLEAAFAILAWHNPVIKMGVTDNRTTRINHSLSYIILNAALKEDEGVSVVTNGQSETNRDNVREKNDLFPQKIVAVFHTIPAIRDYFLLNRHGTVMVQSSPKKKMTDLIIYSIITGMRVGKDLDHRGLNNILLTMKNGRSLMVLFGGGIIMGLLLEEDASHLEITRKIRSALKGNNKR